MPNQLSVGLSVVYRGGDSTAAMRAAEKVGAHVALDDLSASRLALNREWPATVTAVLDDETANLSLAGVSSGHPLHLFAVRHSVEALPHTFRFCDEESTPPSNVS